MKNVMLVMLSLIILAGAGLGWFFAGRFQALQAAHQASLDRVAVLEGQLSVEVEARNKALAEARQATDELTSRDVRIREIESRYNEVAEHIQKMSGELFAARDTLARCEKAREDSSVQMSRLTDDRTATGRERDRETARLKARLEECERRAASSDQAGQEGRAGQ